MLYKLIILSHKLVKKLVLVLNEEKTKPKKKKKGFYVLRSHSQLYLCRQFKREYSTHLLALPFQIFTAMRINVSILFVQQCPFLHDQPNFRFSSTKVCSHHWLRKPNDGPFALRTSAPTGCKGLFYSNILKHRWDQHEDNVRDRNTQQERE